MVRLVSFSLCVSCRFTCPGPGTFQCALTGLVFVMLQEAELLYRTVQWDASILQTSGKIPAGLLFNIKCSGDAICQLHLPHCETEAGETITVMLVESSDEPWAPVGAPYRLQVSLHPQSDPTASSQFVRAQSDSTG